jgi:hypothetical protein
MFAAIAGPNLFAQSRSFVPFLRYEGLEDFTLMIHRAPEIVLLAVDLGVHLIKVPTPMGEAAHPADPLPANVCRKQRSEPVPPEPHGLMADVDPALEEQVFDVPQTQWKPNVHQHHEADHLGRGVEATKRAGRQGSRFAAHAARYHPEGGAATLV